MKNPVLLSLRAILGYGIFQLGTALVLVQQRSTKVTTKTTTRQSAAAATSSSSRDYDPNERRRNNHLVVVGGGDDGSNNKNKNDNSSRRRFLGECNNKLVGGGTLISLMTTLVSTAAATAKPAEAAAPIEKKEAEAPVARAEIYFRKKPPKALRPQMNQKFAVLLMRSSYSVLDELDCVAMDQFQRDFFIIRQSEYLPYIQALGDGFVKQGELTNPYYFDFISFAQYKTINREITQNPPSVFEEQQAIEQGDDMPQKFVTAVVKRDPSITDQMLAPEHSRRVGLLILNRLEETFADWGSPLTKLEPGSRPSADEVLASLSQLVKLFLINGFALDGSATLVSPSSGTNSASGAKFSLSMVTPATIWGGQALKGPLKNDFLLKTAVVLVERLGYQVASTATKYTGTTETNSFTLR